MLSVSEWMTREIQKFFGSLRVREADGVGPVSRFIADASTAETPEEPSSARDAT